MPIDVALSEAAKEGGTGAATLGKVSQGLAATAPIIAGAAGLPGLIQRGVAAGFGAKMLYDAPIIKKKIEEELSKAPADQDKDKLTGLYSDLIQIWTFAPLAGYGYGACGPDSSTLRKSRLSTGLS